MSEYILTGPDGAEFDIKRGPIRLSSAGLMGLSMPPFEDFTRETPARDGQVRTGYRKTITELSRALASRLRDLDRKREA